METMIKIEKSNICILLNDYKRLKAMCKDVLVKIANNVFFNPELMQDMFNDLVNSIIKINSMIQEIETNHKIDIEKYKIIKNEILVKIKFVNSI